MSISTLIKQITLYSGYGDRLQANVCVTHVTRLTVDECALKKK